MFNKKNYKLDALKNEIIDEQETNCFSEISVLIYNFNKNKVSIDDVVKAVEEIPEGKIEMLANDTDNIYDKYKKFLYEYVLYATYFDKFSWLKNKNIQKIVNEEVKKEVEQIDIYSEDISKDLRETIKEVELSSKNSKYIDYNLLIQLFIHKYSNTLESNENELFNSIKSQEDYEVSSKKHKKRAKKLLAKIAFYIMLAIPTYVGPGVASLGLGYRFGKETAAHPYIAINGSEPISTDGLQDSTHIDFTGAFPDDYLTRTLQFVTEFGENKDGRVIVKVYDYTGVDVTQKELDTMKLDEERLIYLNTFKGKNLEGSYISDQTVFGKYTGKAHRDLSTLKYNVSTGELIFHTLLFGTIAAWLSYGILFIIIKKLTNNKDKKALLNAIKATMQERKFELDKSNLDMEEFTKKEKEIDILADRQFARRRANDLDTFNEKYYSNTDEEFEKVLRRK